MVNYRQVLLYAVKTPYGDNVLEGEHIAVRTKSGNEYYGILHDAGRDKIQIAIGDGEIGYLGIYYNEIESLQAK